MLFEGFHLGMGNAVPPGIEGRPAEHHVLLSGNEVFLHPGETFEPDQFHPSGGIVKIGRQALHDFCEIQKAAAKKRG